VTEAGVGAVLVDQVEELLFSRVVVEGGCRTRGDGRRSRQLLSAQRGEQ